MGKLNCKKAFGALRTPCIPGCEDDKNDVTVDKTTLQTLFDATLRFQKRHDVPIWADQLGCSKLQKNMWQWMLDSKSVLGQANANWNWWTWKGGDMGLLQQPADAKSKSDLSTYFLDETIHKTVTYLSTHGQEQSTIAI